jgi:CO/xanthine dehydrogenase Mo-binding subunit
MALFGESKRVCCLDGGAYASTSSAVLANACYFAVGPYRCDSVVVHGAAARTNNPPAGAMRGFGAVQSCFGYESQMDRLAEALGMDPVELRLKNALGHGDHIATTGQVIEGSLPTRRVIEALRDMPLTGCGVRPIRVAFPAAPG